MKVKIKGALWGRKYEYNEEWAFQVLTWTPGSEYVKVRDFELEEDWITEEEAAGLQVVALREKLREERVAAQEKQAAIEEEISKLLSIAYSVGSAK